MKTRTQFQPKGLALVLAGAALLTLAGCGGSPGGTTAAPEVTTQDVVTRVVDGPISNALVCLDKNGNGACDAGEPSGRTDGSGNLTLKVEKADVGKYALVTEVGKDAVDTDIDGKGTAAAVTSAFTMTSTPGKPAVLTPLTTMVALAMQNGATEADAEAQIKDQTGISVSLFEDYSKAKAPTSGPKPGDVARVIVLATQDLNGLTVQPTVQSVDGSTVAISTADTKKAVQKALMNLLPLIAKSVSETSGTVDPKAIIAAVKADVAYPTAKQIENAVVVAKQPQVADVVTVNYSLGNLNFTDANNWFRLTYNSTLAQNTADAQNKRRYVERRERVNTGVLATWNSFNEPSSQANIHWNGSTWVGCTLNQESQVMVPDAQGAYTWNFCDSYSSGNNKRVVFDIADKKMIDVYNQVLAAGYTNVKLGSNAVALLGNATFPKDSKIGYQESQTTKTAYGINSTLNGLVVKNPTSVGGDARPVGANNVCTQSTTALNAQVTTLEDLVASFRGTPCIYNQGSITNVNGTFTSNGPEETWGFAALGFGVMGTAPVLNTPSSFFTTNQLIRLAFTSGSANEVTFYTCKQRQVNGLIRNCTPTGEKATWSIETLPDGSRVMSFSAAPALASTFTYVRTFVERNGKVVYGFKDKLGSGNSARLNMPAANALAAQLGIPANNPDVPLALTAASYQGAWSVNDVGLFQDFTTGTTLSLSATNVGSNAGVCDDRSNNFTPFACTINLTNPATGAFTVTTSGNGGVANGTLGFFSGVVSGSYTNNTTPTPTPITGGRR